MKNKQNLLVLNGINLILLILIGAIYFLSPPPVAIVLGIVWLGWVIYGNYETLIKDNDPVYQFEQQIDQYNKRSKGLFMNRYGQIPRTLIENYRIILAKEDFFSSQPETIQEAYRLIQKKALWHFRSAVNYLSQYDFVTLPRPTHLDRLRSQSQELVRKLHELSEDCFMIEDQGSDVDISIVNDLLTALREMQDED